MRLHKRGLVHPAYASRRRSKSREKCLFIARRWWASVVGCACCMWVNPGITVSIMEPGKGNQHFPHFKEG